MWCHPAGTRSGAGCLFHESGLRQQTVTDRLYWGITPGWCFLAIGGMVMSNQVKALRRALRFSMNGEHPCALLELNAVLAEHSDLWLAYAIRGRVREAMKRLPEAISDYVRVLSEPHHLNRRNALRMLESIVVCATKLSDIQRKALARLLEGEFGMSGLDWWRLVEPVVEMPSSMRYAAPARAPKPLVNPVSTGRIVNIGKFLLDQKDLEKLNNLLNSGDPTRTGVRSLSTYTPSPNAPSTPPPKKNIRKIAEEAQAQMKKLMRAIDRHKAVIGSCVVGRTGIPLMNTLPDIYDPEWYGIHAIGVYLNASKASQILGHTKLCQVVMRTTQGYVIVVDIGNAFLIVITNELEPPGLCKVMKKITTTIAE